MSDPILARLAEGTLIRRAWTGTDAQGRATACLLVALVPACGVQESPSACPSQVMPAWLATLSPWIDDAGTDAAWEGHIREYARIAPHFGRLSAEPDTGRIAMIGSLRAIVAEAVTHTDPDGAVSAVLALLDREIGGDCPTAAEYARSAAAACASAQATYAASAAVNAASSAEYAAYAATDDTPPAVAAEYANAAAAYANAAAAYANAANADYANADRVITGILAAIADALGVGRV